LTDGIALVRALGALLTVLGVLAGALWAVRRYNIVLPGVGGARTDRRLAVVERLSLDPRRSLALVRRDGVEHLVLIAPEGHLVIETSIAPPAIVVAENVSVPRVAPAHEGHALFGALVERARHSAIAARHAGAGKIATWSTHHE
jgi:hypothetical protein